mmetsp:Transcript_25684/g.83993  ORF Transcript_25684/g.83993 Transcript_25684/m.83993 type:complete len:354 (+) Transcript_25684:58-1119(+)
MQPLLNPLAATSPPRSLVRDGAFWTAVLTTANAALGAGVLAYPIAFQGAGLAGGSLLLLGFATTASVGLGAVFQCMSAARRLDPRVRDYTKMVGAAYGTTAEALVTVLIVLYVFGACWGYLVLLSDTLGPLVRKVAPAVDESLVRILLQCGSTAVCIGLCSLRSINTLKYSSALAVAAVLTTVVMLVRNYAAHPCTAGDCATAAGPTVWCLPSPGSSPVPLCLWPLHGSVTRPRRVPQVPLRRVLGLVHRGAARRRADQLPGRHARRGALAERRRALPGRASARRVRAAVPHPRRRSVPRDAAAAAVLSRCVRRNRRRVVLPAHPPLPPHWPRRLRRLWRHHAGRHPHKLWRR